MKKVISTTLALGLTIAAYAQKNDGSTKSLVNAEKDFAKTIAKKGDKEAYLEYALPSALVFRPNPVNVKTFYNGQTKTEKGINWEPNFAKVSRSGDFGFTTGSYSIDGSQKKYGQYLSIWLADDNTWKLAVDLGTSSNKPITKFTAQFIEPKDHYSPQFINTKEKKAGKDIILTTEKTLNTMLKTHGVAAFSGFITKNTRLIFPGNEAIEGSDKIVAYLSSMVDKISLKTTSVDRALAGDLAYSYGVATVDYKTDLRESFNYVFVYEKAEDGNWNILVQAFVPAER